MCGEDCGSLWEVRLVGCIRLIICDRLIRPSMVTMLTMMTKDMF